VLSGWPDARLSPTGELTIPAPDPDLGILVGLLEKLGEGEAPP
jgi:hypothetical protein